MLLRGFHGSPRSFFLVYCSRWSWRPYNSAISSCCWSTIFLVSVRSRSASSNCFIALLSDARRLAISTFCPRIVAFNSSMLFFMVSFSCRMLQISILISTSISLSSVRDGSTGASDDSCCPVIASIEVGSARLACCSFEIGSAVAAILDRLGVPVSSSHEPLAPRLCFLLFTMSWFLMMVIVHLNQRLEKFEFLEKNWGHGQRSSRNVPPHTESAHALLTRFSTLWFFYFVNLKPKMNASHSQFAFIFNLENYFPSCSAGPISLHHSFTSR